MLEIDDNPLGGCKEALRFEGGPNQIKLEEKNTAKRTTRDLVFDDEDEGDVNTKQQVAPKGEPFVAHYVLTHK